MGRMFEDPLQYRETNRVSQVSPTLVAQVRRLPVPVHWGNQLLSRRRFPQTPFLPTPTALRGKESCLPPEALPEGEGCGASPRPAGHRSNRRVLTPSLLDLLADELRPVDTLRAVAVVPGAEGLEEALVVVMEDRERLRVLDLEPRPRRATRPVKTPELASVARSFEDALAHLAGQVA